MICNQVQACAAGEVAGKPQAKCANHNRKECIVSSDKRSRVKCEERTKKYLLENTMRNHVISYKMDGGIIRMDRSVPEGTCKCDDLFLVHGAESHAVLVELKGINVAHALKQLQGTLTLFQNFLGKFSHVHGRIVVTSSTPDLKASPDYVNLARMLRQKFHGNLKIAERQMGERDVDLDKSS